MKAKARVAIFASGRGSNARAIYDYQKNHKSSFEIAAVFSNRKNAPVLDFGRSIPVFTQDLERKLFYNTEEILTTLDDLEIDIIVLAGKVHHRWMQGRFLAGQVLNKRGDAALIFKSHRLLIALISENYPHAGIKKTQLPQTLSEDVIMEIGVGKHWAFPTN